jgi:hypothetical protein
MRQHEKNDSKVFSNATLKFCLLDCHKVFQQLVLNHLRKKTWNKFFDLLKPELKKINFNPNRLYSFDEIGVSVVQHSNTKVIAMKGKKSVASLTSAECGCLITVVTCMHAVEHYVPPLLVFPQKNMQTELMDGTSPGSTYACHISRWIQTDNFTWWFRQFYFSHKINYRRSSLNNT